MKNVTLDLKFEPLAIRNKVMSIVHRERMYYNLTNQILTVNFKDAKKIFSGI